MTSQAPLRPRTVGLLCVILIIAVLASRVALIASRTDTGFQTLQRQWGDAVRELALQPRIPMSLREPNKQAEIWLRQADRVVAADPRNAELAIGAALVLDCPTSGYVTRYIRGIHNFPGSGQIPDLDDAGIRRANDDFENKCKSRCLELAAAATKLEPTNVDWWRLRALLLWRHALYSYDSAPRDPNWQTVLDECAAHDPDNALYDYLAAYFLWELSAEIDYSGATDRLLIHDRATFDRGHECFRHGQSKPLFVVGDAGFTAAASFVSAAGIPRAEQPDVVNSRCILYRRSMLLRTNARWQGQLADEAIAVGDFRDALALHRENVRLYDQFGAAGRSAKYDDTLLPCRTGTAAKLVELATDFQNELTPDELHEIQSIAERASIDHAVVQHAAQSLTSGKQQQSSAGISLTRDARTTALFMTVATLASTVIAFALLGLLATLLACRSSDSPAAEITVAEHALMLLSSLGITVAVFGLAPAGIISERAQAWGLTILILAAPLALVAWAAWTWRRPARLQFSLRSVMICFLVVSLLLALAALMRPVAVSFSTFPFQLKIPALNWYAWDATVLETLIRPVASWLWPACQWTLYLGPYLTVAIWATFVATLLHLKSQLQERDLHQPAPSLRDRIREFCQTVRTPCWVLAAIALIAYLLIAPTTIDIMERHFQSQIAFARNPDDHWAKVEREVRAVRANQPLMTEIVDASRFELTTASEDDAE